MVEDNYQAKPKGSYEERRQAYLEFCAAQSPGGVPAFAARLPGWKLLRILYLYRDSPHLSGQLISSIEDRILNFKYWWDEAGGDNHRCYWTENHQIIFHHDETHPTNELRAKAPTNGWIVEMGDEIHWDSFVNFVEVVSGAPVEIAGLGVTYGSPSVGLVQFGWRGPLRVGGNKVELHDYPRFQNPYCRADFASRHYTIRYGDQVYSGSG